MPGSSAWSSGSSVVSSLAEPRAGEQQRHEPAGDRRGRVAELRQLVLITMNRDGSLPVHWSRYFRFTVIVSSPEIASSRSTTTWLPRPAIRASEMTASGLPISGASPKSPDRDDSVGPATLSGPISAPSDARDRALAAAGRPDEQQDLVEVEPAR